MAAQPKPKVIGYLDRLNRWAQPLSELELQRLAAECERDILSVKDTRLLCGTHIAAATIAHRLGLYDEQLRHAKRAAELAPDMAETRANLGIAYLGVGQPHLALPILIEVLKDNSVDEMSRIRNLLNLAENLHRLGAIEDAHATFDAAIRLVGPDPDMNTIFMMAAQAAEIERHDYALRFFKVMVDRVFPRYDGQPANSANEALERVSMPFRSAMELPYLRPLLDSLLLAIELEREASPATDGTAAMDGEGLLALFEATRAMRGRATEDVLRGDEHVGSDG